MKRFFLYIKAAIKLLWSRHHFLIPPRLWKRYFVRFFKKMRENEEFLNPFVLKEYNKWLSNQNNEMVKKMSYEPLISFIIPVYNIEKEFLEDCLDSILNQTYKNFEICIADDASTKLETIETLKEYEKKDKRVKVVYRKENGHISKASNSALEIASGEYIALMDDDDIISSDALYYAVKAINNDITIDFIYSDEDKMNMDGTLCEPHFKPDFSLDSFYGGNYICHFTVIKRELLDKIGFFREQYVGAQDFDLFLRAVEKAKKIYHIPKILYHWRKVPGSTADTIENKEYAIENGKKAVEDSLKRRKIIGTVSVPLKCTHYIVHYEVKTDPLVSVIMLDNSRYSINNNLDVLNKADYKKLEIFINYSNKINIKNNKFINIKLLNNRSLNEIIGMAKGEHILIISGKINTNQIEWIKELVGYSSQKQIGAVGPKLLNYDGTIKSAGLVLSNKNIYADAFAGYFSDSVGFYGRLVVPYDYSALASQCVMFSKKKYNEVKGFMDDVDIDIANIDFCLKLLEKGYRNVLLSHIGLKQQDNKKTKRYEILDKDRSILSEKWNLDDNTYYNENLSKTFPFMLDRFDIDE